MCVSVSVDLYLDRNACIDENMYLQRYIDMRTRTRAHTHTQTHAHAMCVFIYFWRVRYTNLCVCEYLHFFHNHLFHLFYIQIYLCDSAHETHIVSLSPALSFPLPSPTNPSFFPSLLPFLLPLLYTVTYTHVQRRGFRLARNHVIISYGPP